MVLGREQDKASLAGAQGAGHTPRESPRLGETEGLEQTGQRGKGFPT